MGTRQFNSCVRTWSSGGAASRFRTTCSCLAVAALVGVVTPPAIAHSHQSPEVNRLSVEQLKRFYLWCGRAAASGQLDNGAIMQCSIFYEALKERAFGGDFEQLLAWSRAESAAVTDKR